MRRIAEGLSGRFLKAAGLAAFCATAALLSSCSGKTAGAGAAKAGAPIPVRVAEATSRDVPVEFKTFGVVTPSATVSVKAQVNGILKAIHFQRGDYVRKDALLFEIDPAPFKAALEQAQANLDKDKVLAANAKKDAEREKGLQKKGYAPDSEVEKFQADADALAAALLADKAAVDNARIQLQYCSISSPITGRAGDRLVDEGNLVKLNDMTLVVVNQVQPILVSFSVPQKELLRIRRNMAAGSAKLAVRASLPHEDEPVETGELIFVDNAVDTASGMARLIASFQNKDERLWPGDYVDVTLTLAMQKGAVIAPAQAVQVGRDSKYVYVVKQDNTVEMRDVTVRPLSTREVVVNPLEILADGKKKKGLQPGERVVTDNQFRLTDKSQVEIAKDAKDVPKATADGSEKVEKAKPQEAGS